MRLMSPAKGRSFLREPQSLSGLGGAGKLEVKAEEPCWLKTKAQAVWLKLPKARAIRVTLAAQMALEAMRVLGEASAAASSQQPGRDALPGPVGHAGSIARRPGRQLFHLCPI